MSIACLGDKIGDALRRVRRVEQLGPKCVGGDSRAPGGSGQAVGT